MTGLLQRAKKAASAAFFFGACCAGLTGLAAGLSACATNPVTGEANFVLMSEAEELRLGAQADQQVKKEYSLYDLRPKGVPRETGLQAYVEELGQKLARQSHRPDLAYRFTVVDSPEINAFALPGGYIYITRGILAYLNSEAELAAVLGHEIGHVTARHSVRQASAARGADLLLSVLGAVSPGFRGAGQNISSVVGGALLAGYGRDQELEADRLGAEYLARTGYDLQAMIRVVGALKNQELFDAELARIEGREPRRYHGLFASHPDNDTRLREVIAAAGKLRREDAPDNRDEFLAHTEGMVFGDSAHQGLVREGLFLHPDLGFTLSLPRDWQVNNLPDRLILTAPRTEARLTLIAGGKPQGTPVDLLRRAFRIRAADADITPANGLPFALSTEGGDLAAVVYHRESAYLLRGEFASEAAWKQHLGTIRTAVRSFRDLSPAERALARPLNLARIRATGETRFAKLAADSPLGRSAESQLRLINSLYPAGEPRPGAWVKVVR